MIINDNNNYNYNNGLVVNWRTWQWSILYLSIHLAFNLFRASERSACVKLTFCNFSISIFGVQHPQNQSLHLHFTLLLHTLNLECQVAVKYFCNVLQTIADDVILFLVKIVNAALRCLKVLWLILSWSKFLISLLVLHFSKW